ncbi:MAG TPA: PAS domain S-box protein [Burkholderiales bacterium]|nr:PAS domain S-box protein [Burkholderiales bacterium]
MGLALGSALAESEGDLADFFENAAIPLHWVDRNGVILRANRAELECLGYTAQEYVGHNIAEFHADSDGLSDILRRLTKGETLRDVAARMRRRDGSLIDVRITSNVKWKDGEFVHTRCITRDVSAERHADDVIAQTADYLEGMLEGFVAYDADWRMTYMNRAAEQLLGRDRREVLGKRWREAFPHAVGNPVDHMYQRVMGSRQAERMEYRYPHYDNRWLEISASPVKTGGVAVYFRDVSELKRREEVQSRLAAIVESSEDAIISKSLEGIVQSWNAAAERMYGYSAAETVGRSILLVIPREMHAEEDQILARLRAGERIEHYDTVRRTKDGRMIDVSITVSPVRDATGTVVGASKTARDITARKATEKALEDANRYKDEFLAMLAHELRNPLAPISNALQLMRVVDPSSGQAMQARAIMERQLTHLVRLVDDLMEVSRITRGKIELRKEPVLLSTVMLSAVETARPAIEAAQHNFRIDMPAETIELEADFVRLAQVISNLLGNAAKYTDHGGEITLAAECRDGEAVIRVRDNGIGIAPEMLPGIFEMFAQVEGSVKRSQGGLGIGLALARALVELHGGRIEANSAGRGQGAEFTVRLPLARAAPQPAPRASQGTRAKGRTRRRVLIVDDNVDAAETLQMVIASMGHEVEAAHDGHAALAAARSRRPDVVLLDISMPGMDGLTVARELRREPDMRKIRVVALTGFGQEADRRRSEEAGFDDHLVKPVSPEQLRRVLEP